MDSIAQTLIQAKERLVNEGWIKDALHTDEGYCLVGAVRPSGYLDRQLAFDLLNQVIKEQYPGEHVLYTVAGKSDVSFGGWNDDKSRTKDEVLAVLDKAILLAEEDAS